MSVEHSCVHWLFLCRLWRHVYWDLCPFLKWASCLSKTPLILLLPPPHVPGTVGMLRARGLPSASETQLDAQDILAAA